MAGASSRESWIVAFHSEEAAPPWLRLERKTCRQDAGANARGPLSIQSVFFALVEQGFAADAQDLRGLADFVARGFKRGANRVALQIVERTQRAGNPALRRAHRLGEILGDERSPAGKHQRALDGISQLAHVTRPGIGHQHLLYRLRK